MAIDKFTFYARHYSDVVALMTLTKQIEEEFPVRLGSILEDAFKSAELAGVERWGYEHNASRSYFGFWDPAWCPDGKYGVWYSINPLSNAVATLGTPSIAQTKELIRCQFAFEAAERSRPPIRYKNLLTVAQKESRRLRRAGLHVVIEPKSDPDISMGVGDLLHISTFENRERNINALLRRVAKFLRAFAPVIEKAARM